MVNHCLLARRQMGVDFLCKGGLGEVVSGRGWKLSVYFELVDPVPWKER